MYSSMNYSCRFALYVIQYTNNVGHLEVKLVQSCLNSYKVLFFIELHAHCVVG